MFRFDFIKEEEESTEPTSISESTPQTEKNHYVTAAELEWKALIPDITALFPKSSTETLRFHQGFDIIRIVQPLEFEEYSSDDEEDEANEKETQTKKHERSTGNTKNKNKTHLSKTNYANLEDVTATSDLVPNIYEGGFKLWECANDLVNYLVSDESPFNFKGKRVLELGCGHGIPAIVASKLGAQTVHFQDYNPEVLENITIPNAIANKLPEQQIKFICGDWSDFSSVISEKNAYDIILATETVYAPQNYQKFYNVIKDNLKKDTGVCILAQKLFYFGVGGGVYDFLELVKKDNQMKSTELKQVLKKNQNQRMIFSLQFLEKN